MPTLFNTVPKEEVFNFYENGKLDCKKVVNFFGYHTKDVAKATGIPERSIRYDNRIPENLYTHLIEWANAINLVGSFFRDPQKTVLWFEVPNPLLGNLSPKEMIKLGRFKKLIKFIQQSIDENIQQVKKPSHAPVSS